MSKKEEKSKKSEEEIEDHGLFYTKKEPRKSMSTFLRNQNKFMISGIVIADRKAMILLRLNSSIISGAIILHDYIDENVPMGHMIGTVIVVGLSISLILTILAAKPFGRRIANIFKKEIEPNHPKFAQNSFFMVQDTTIEEFEEAIDVIIHSQELQIGNQVRAHYLFNRSINYSFKLLDFAYNLFLGTFILVALIFMFGRYFMGL